MTVLASSPLRRYALTALVLLPLLVMSVFPQGTMATRGAHGMEVVLCTGDGPLTVIVDENGTPIDDAHNEVSCGWWLLGQSLVLVATADAEMPVSTGMQLVAGIEYHDVRLSRAAAFYPARAPPPV